MPATLDGPPTAAIPQHRVVRAWWVKVIRFVLAVACSALGTLVAINLLPSLLPAHTDIVGFPIWAPFDVRRYTATYVLWMVLFPGLATIGYVLLGRSARSAASPVVERAESSSTTPTYAAPKWVGRVAALSAVVVVVLPGAFSLGVGAQAHGWPFDKALVVTTLGPVVLLVLVAAVADRRRAVAFDDAAWALAALVAPTGFLALSVLSSRTGILVTSTGTFHGLDWFPYWLGIPVTGLAVGVASWSLLRRPSRDWASIGRWSLICCTIPALLWVLVGSIAPALGPIDAFHEGEGLVGSQLLLDGRFPWRDFLSTHGLLQDSLVALPGLAFIADSRWGAMSGELVWLTPAYWICWFAFMAYLLRRNRWLLVLWCALVIIGPSALTNGPARPRPWISPTLMSQTYVRSVLYPLILLAMAWVVRKPVSGRIALLSGLMVLQVVLTPETAYIVPGVLMTLVAFDWSRSRGEPSSRRFRASTLAALWCFVLSATFAIFLAMASSLDAFIDHFRVFAVGHDLTGASPFAWGGWVFSVSALGVPLLFLIVIWYGIARLITRRPFELDDFVIMPAFFFAALYYTKFLNRADLPHSIQSWTISLPVLWYVIARLLGVADRAWWRWAPPGRAVAHGASILVVGVTVVLLVPALSSRAADTPTRYRTRAPAEPLTERLGYTTQTSDNVFLQKAEDVFLQKAEDVRKVVDALAPGTRQVFDFTNSPGFFEFVLPYSPPTRYYHISMAIPLAAQREVIGDLRRSRPKVVVGYGDAMGLFAWDGILNMVRHYAVNRYLQTHYRPVVALDGFVFLLRDDTQFNSAAVRELDLHGAPAFGNLDKVSYPCDWRAVPERFAPQPARHAKRTGALAPITLEGTLRITGWAVDPATGEPAAQVVALGADRTVLAANAPSGDRPDVAALPGLTSARTSGFSLDVPVVAGESVVVAARRADGTILQIDGAIGRVVSPRLGENIVAGRTRSVGSGRGSIEAVSLVPVPAGVRAYRVLVPGGPRDWNWLTLQATKALAVGPYTIGLPAGDGQTRLLLTQGGQQTTSLMVGACNQWYDYQTQVRVISTPEGVPTPGIEFMG